jgi:hypothetical protein
MTTNQGLCEPTRSTNRINNVTGINGVSNINAINSALKINRRFRNITKVVLAHPKSGQQEGLCPKSVYMGCYRPHTPVALSHTLFLCIK